MSTGRLPLALTALGSGSPNYLRLRFFSIAARFVPSRCRESLSQQRRNTNLLPDKVSFLDSMEGIQDSSRCETVWCLFFLRYLQRGPLFLTGADDL